MVERQFTMTRPPMLVNQSKNPGQNTNEYEQLLYRYHIIYHSFIHSFHGCIQDVDDTTIQPILVARKRR